MNLKGKKKNPQQAWHWISLNLTDLNKIFILFNGNISYQLTITVWYIDKIEGMSYWEEINGWGKIMFGS